LLVGEEDINIPVLASMVDMVVVEIVEELMAILHHLDLELLMLHQDRLEPVEAAVAAVMVQIMEDKVDPVLSSSDTKYKYSKTDIRWDLGHSEIHLQVL
jgi:hypothetical protein